MATSVRRRFAARLLLLVYVPVMVAVSLHVHEGDATAGCEQCAQHIRHNGHLDPYADNVCDCVLCQFASLPYVVPTAVAVAVAFIVYRAVYADRTDGLRLGVCGVGATRAPPVF